MIICGISMKKKIPLILLAVFAFETGSLFADEPKMTVDGAPMRYTFVDGDSHKFREQNWMKENYAGGLEKFSFEQKNLLEDLSIAMDGHAIVQDNDYEANVRLDKKNFGYTKFEYQEFSKYYDDTGGVYYPFSTLSVNSLGRELELQVGRIRVEAGLTLEDMPHVTVAYERRFKDGAKSRLTWAPVKVGTVTRNIAPSFQDIHETTDSVEIKIEHTVKGIEIKNEETWEWVNSDLSREERYLATTGVAADNRIRVQNQKPKSKLFSTTNTVQRWFKDDRVFTGGAYHFQHMSNSEIEDVFEMNQNRVITTFSKQIRNARADNEYDAHTWVGNFMFSPWKSFSVTANLRPEVMGRSGNSSYPSDTTAGIPDGIINTTELSRTEDKAIRLGEGISLRYTGIPRTALYNDFEFEQARNWLSEDRDSQRGQSAPNANEIFGRETITYVSRGIWTVGGQWVPAHWAHLTAHFRINRNNSDYDDTRETQPGATAAKSAFFDALNIQTQEMATHLTFKPSRWFRPSIRYHYQIRSYMARTEDLASVETNMDSHIFVFDASIQPMNDLLIVTGISPQYAWIETPARDSASGNTPRFQANLLTWFMNLDYNLSSSVSLVNNLEYSVANNFNDFTAGGLPLGAAYHQLNFSAGINWNITKRISLELQYAFYRYAANEQVDSGSYNANQIGINTKLNWA